MDTSEFRQALQHQEKFAPDPEAVTRDLDRTRDSNHRRRRAMGRWAVPVVAASAAAAIIFTAVVLSLSNRTPSPAATNGPATSTALAPTVAVTSGSHTPTESTPRVPPLPNSGPVPMVPGTPGVNQVNQTELTRYAAGGPGKFLLKNGCVYVQLDGMDPRVAAFDTGSTQWDGTAIAYWGYRVTFGEHVNIGFGAFSDQQFTSEYPDNYLPASCGQPQEILLINTVETLG